MDAAAPTPEPVEAARLHLHDLMLAREQLRSAGAGPDVLEGNRREIVAAQWDLSHALIERYLPPAAKAA